VSAGFVRKLDDKAEQAIRRVGWNTAVVTVSADHVRQLCRHITELHAVLVMLDSQAPVNASGPSPLRVHAREVIANYERFDGGETL